MNLYKQYAREFTDAGYSVIPDKFASKQPAIKGWTNYCENNLLIKRLRTGEIVLSRPM